MVQDSSPTAASGPYDHRILGRDVLASLEQVADRIATITRDWTEADFARTYAPGKWTARQLLIHLAHQELVFGGRARFGVVTPDYRIVPYDQDQWMAVDGTLDGASARDAYLAMRRMNLAFFRGLDAAQLARAFPHPDFGRIDVWWIIRTLAGHERAHLEQLEAIAEQPRA